MLIAVTVCFVLYATSFSILSIVCNEGSPYYVYVVVFHRVASCNEVWFKYPGIPGHSKSNCCWLQYLGQLVTNECHETTICSLSS